MGIYITLKILPGLISSQEWEETIQETWQLLQAYPFITLRQEKIGKIPRLVYSKNLEFEKDTPKHRWSVTGDAVTKKTAETFVMYHLLSNYGEPYSGGKPLEQREGDIVQDLAGDDDSNLTIVFNDKTQGEDYHLYVLAIAMLVESRLPRAAIVEGDFNIRQAAKACDWANQVLSRPIELPVLVCPERLLTRLARFYSGRQLIDKFMGLYLNHEEFIPKVLIERVGYYSLKEWLTSCIKSYSSLSQVGALKTIINWLNSTADLATLCRVCCLEQAGPRFDILEFTRELCSTWVTIPPEQRFRFSPENPEQPDTVNTQLYNMIYDLGFTGRHIRCYIPSEKVVEIIAGFFPELKQKIAAIVEDETAGEEKRLAEHKNMFSQIKQNDTESPVTMDELIDNYLYYNEESSISEVELYYPVYMVYRLIEMWHQIIDEQPVENEYHLVWNSPDLLKVKIMEQSWKNRICLTEEAWQRIDREENIQVLRVVLALVLEKDNSLWFTRLRRALLENRLLLDKVVDIMYDKQFLNQAVSFVESCHKL